jgi:hypothetical protein
MFSRMRSHHPHFRVPGPANQHFCQFGNPGQDRKRRLHDIGAQPVWMARRRQDMFIRWQRPLNARTAAALYETITDEKTVSEDKDAANCRVCGKQMDATKGSILRYELVKMPDGTNV